MTFLFSHPVSQPAAPLLPVNNGLGMSDASASKILKQLEKLQIQIQTQSAEMAAVKKELAEVKMVSAATRTASETASKMAQGVRKLML